MPKLASYLVKSRHGVFYIRLQSGGKDRRVSLGTKDPMEARSRAYAFGAKIHTMSKKSLGYGMKLPSGIEITTDGTKEDHDRAMEALRHAQLLEEAKYQQIRSRVSSPEFADEMRQEMAKILAESQPAVFPTGDDLPTEASRLQDAIDAYLVARNDDVEERTITSFRSLLDRLVKEFGPGRMLHELRTADIDKIFNVMKDPLHPDHISKSTIDNYASCWRKFFEWCQKRYVVRRGLVDVPFINEKSAKKLSKGNKVRVKWSAEDMRNWFSIDNLDDQVRHDLLLIPIIALYTGARLEAIGRLKLQDITEYAPGKWQFWFDPDYDKCGRERDTPMHPILIEIGLLDYMTDIRAMGYQPGDYLFPELKESDSRRTHYVSKRFGELRKALGVCDGSDLHAFRSTVVSCLAKNGCKGYPRRAYVGHEEGDPVDTHEEHYTKPEFGAEAIAELVFPFLDYQKSDGFVWPGWKYKSGSVKQFITTIVGRDQKKRARNVRLQGRRKPRGKLGKP